MLLIDVVVVVDAVDVGIVIAVDVVVVVAAVVAWLINPVFS